VVSISVTSESTVFLEKLDRMIAMQQQIDPKYNRSEWFRERMVDYVSSRMGF
jgi:hypothetical protein